MTTSKFVLFANQQICSRDSKYSAVESRDSYLDSSANSRCRTRFSRYQNDPSVALLGFVSSTAISNEVGEGRDDNKSRFSFLLLYTVSLPPTRLPFPGDKEERSSLESVFTWLRQQQKSRTAFHQATYYTMRLASTCRASSADGLRRR